ncbi:hypothetical protein CDD83_8207 [Cordyceps sp. RAO-2017]|nr:hypothetical protein CDD83_8207 [Cordyceps sp. RAO-2017]
MPTCFRSSRGGVASPCNIFDEATSPPLAASPATSTQQLGASFSSIATARMGKRPEFLSPVALESSHPRHAATCWEMMPADTPFPRKDWGVPPCLQSDVLGLADQC